MISSSHSNHVFVTVAAIATMACSTADQSDGERSFAANCGTCHSAAELPERRVKGLADPQKRAALDQFLARHHAADPEARAKILEYLAAQEK